jgi:hypothetical protein
MTRFTAVFLLCALIAATTGCFRATYSHLYGRDDAAPVTIQSAPVERASSWQNFFLFGQIPGRNVVESGEICGNRGVREIATQVTFGQGAIGGVTYSIYRPWTGATHCR